MKRKVIQLKESELKRLISRIIEEQQTVSGVYSQGKTAGLTQGQQARQVVNKAALSGAKAIKETIITIGKYTFKVVIIGAAVVYLVGNAIYKVSQAASNAILKFLSATGKAAVKAGTQASDATMQRLKAAGIAIEKGGQYIQQQLSALRDSSAAMGQWAINLFKQFGTQAWAKILVAAGGIQEFNAMVGNYLKNSWASIQNQVGVTWDNASKWASGAFNSAKQAVSNTANRIGTSVKNKAGELARSAASTLGNTIGSIQGFLSEMYERYHSFSNDTLSILSEGRSYNGKMIL